MQIYTYALVVKGKSGKEYMFNIEANPEIVVQWELEGIEVIGPRVGWVPEWVVDIGLSRIWFFIQDVFNYRNPHN